MLDFGFVSCVFVIKKTKKKKKKGALAYLKYLF